jgi:orotate phosphoribosyltransferase
MQIKDLLLQYKAIEFGDFELSSGQKSNYYVDIKTALTHPELLNVISRKIISLRKFDMVAGVSIGGIPLAVSISAITVKPYVIIRKEQRDHGKTNLIIGDNVKNKNIILVEDVTTTGASVSYGVRILKEAGAIIRTVITVVDREQGADLLLERDGVSLVPLVKISEVL